MFNQLYLIIEENKLKKRFKGNVVTAVLEVLNKETDVQRLELIYQTLWRFISSETSALPLSALDTVERE